MARDALERGTTDPYMYLIQGWALSSRPRHGAEAATMFKKCIVVARGEENNEAGIMNICAVELAQTLARMHRFRAADRAFSWGMSFTSGWRPKGLAIAPPDFRTSVQGMPVTTANYRTLARILRRRGIALVAMQYPGWKIERLKTMLRGQPGIVFVDNKPSFARALSAQPYDQIFTDRWEKTWGHCTAEGNSLIARNAADALAPLLSGGRCGN